MEPTKVPQKLIDQDIGILRTWTVPDSLQGEVGDLPMLVLVDPRQLRAKLLGKELPFPPGSTDLWISWWQPTELERHKIAAGAPIRICFFGIETLNPMDVSVGTGISDLPLFREEKEN